MQRANGLVADLLIEFLTEELPPINLEKNIGQAFSLSLYDELSSFCSDTSKVDFFVSPRRFACLITNMQDCEAQQKKLRKGPAIQTALQNNQPTNALLGFIRSCGVSNYQDLHQGSDGYFYFEQTVLGKTLESVLPYAITNALKKLPIAKNMRWGNNDYQFVRPVHNLLLRYGDTVLCQATPILGLMPVGYTFGHRIMSQGKIVITNPSNYVEQLENVGMVIPNYAKRKDLIKQQLTKVTSGLGLTLNASQDLIEEVTALVEYPVVLQGEFDSIFLEVPQECLILSMAKNQKYFALLDKENKLANKFLFVANQISPKPEVIIHGNEKVLAARLSDAKFFYDVDKKHTLTDFTQKLVNVVYHNQLGSQLDRVHRLQNIASAIATLLNGQKELAQHTAYLIKADLMTEMVGEFPELQGVMGKYYALIHGEEAQVANAIEKHYYPRFSGDILPDSDLATILALADKLEALVGIWGIGLVPTGDKDPFALRRAALGVARILLVTDLDLLALLQLTYATFNKFNLNSVTVTEVYQFILQRLYHYLTTECQHESTCVQSIILNNPTKFVHIPKLLEILNQFALDSNNEPLLNANKRVENILKKNQQLSQIITEINTDLFTHEAEKNVYVLLIESETQGLDYQKNNQWGDYFSLLAKFNHPVSQFFDNVMVMDQNLELQNNRLALLQRLYMFLNQCCKLSELN